MGIERVHVALCMSEELLHGFIVTHESGYVQRRSAIAIPDVWTHAELQLPFYFVCITTLCCAEHGGHLLSLVVLRLLRKEEHLYGRLREVFGTHGIHGFTGALESHVLSLRARSTGTRPAPPPGHLGATTQRKTPLTLDLREHLLLPPGLHHGLICEVDVFRALLPDEVQPIPWFAHLEGVMQVVQAKLL